MMKYVFTILLVAVSASIGATYPVWGEPGTLEEGLIGNWSVVGNWFEYTDDPSWTATGSSFVPGATDTAVIKTGEAQIDSNVGSVAAVQIGADVGQSSPAAVTGKLSISSGGALEITDQGLDLGVYGYDTGTGVLEQTGGTLTLSGSNALSIGNGSSGLFNISGGTLNLNNSFTMKIYSDSEMNISGSADINVTAGDLNIGVLGPGVVVNQTGGSVYSDDRLIVGDRSNAVATYNFEDGSLEPKGGVAVCNRGAQGTLNISGGSLDTTTTSGAGNFNVGREGALSGDGVGEIGIVNQSGGIVDTGWLEIGYEPNSVGRYTMTGGELTADVIILAHEIGSEGELVISGGSLYCYGNLAVGYGDNRNEGDGGGNATLKIVGSDPNIVLENRLDVKKKNTPTVEWVMDENGVSTIECYGLALMTSSNSEFAIDVLPEFDGQVGDTFDLVYSHDRLDAPWTDVVNRSPYYTFSYAAVDTDEDGDTDTLRATLEEINIDTCDDIKGAGKLKAGDINEDCIVNLEDFAIMAADWLVCNDPQGCE